MGPGVNACNVIGIVIKIHYTEQLNGQYVQFDVYHILAAWPL